MSRAAPELFGIAASRMMYLTSCMSIPAALLDLIAEHLLTFAQSHVTEPSAKRRYGAGKCFAAFVGTCNGGLDVTQVGAAVHDRHEVLICHCMSCTGIEYDVEFNAGTLFCWYNGWHDCAGCF